MAWDKASRRRPAVSPHSGLLSYVLEHATDEPLLLRCGTSSCWRESLASQQRTGSMGFGDPIITGLWVN